MNSAKPVLLAVFCLLVFNFNLAKAQERVAGTAIIAGRVTVDNGAVAGLQVILQQVKEQPAMLTAPPPLTAATDAEGNYQFTNVPAGKYSLDVHAPAYIIERKEREGGRASLEVEEGANLQNLDFKLRRGGVITGKLTDNEGQPLIEERLQLMPVNEAGQPAGGRAVMPTRLWRTDDRGVYRLFGIEPGRYLVYAGGGNNPLAGFLGGQPEFSETYYPGTINQAAARPVEVRAGIEAEGINFALVRATAKKGYVASGRVVESDTGKPVAGLMLMYVSAAGAAPPAEEKANEARPESGGGLKNGTSTTNANGEFRFENIASGSYSVMAMNLQAFMGGGTETYAEPMSFEIRGGDSTGLVMKMLRGTTISGTAVIEGARNPQMTAKLAGLMVMGMPFRDPAEAAGTGANPFNMGSMAMGSVQADGVFRLTGVAPGKVKIEARSISEQSLRLLRVEQNGAAVEHIEVQSATPVTGVRLVFGEATGTVMGRVEARGATLPSGATIRIIASSKDPSTRATQYGFAQADARGRFKLSDLLPGTYEIEVRSIVVPGQSPLEFEAAPYTVVVAGKSSQEIVLYVDLKAKEKN